MYDIANVRESDIGQAQNKTNNIQTNVRIKQMWSGLQPLWKEYLLGPVGGESLVSVLMADINQMWQVADCSIKSLLMAGSGSRVQVKTESVWWWTLFSNSCEWRAVLWWIFKCIYILGILREDWCLYLTWYSMGSILLFKSPPSHYSGNILGDIKLE